VAENRDKLEMMSEALMKYETIDSAQIDQIMEGEIPDPPDGWDESSSGDGKKDQSDSASGSSTSSGDSPSIGDTAEQH